MPVEQPYPGSGPADQLLADLRRVLDRLDRQTQPMRDPVADSSFGHTGAPSPR